MALLAVVLLCRTAGAGGEEEAPVSGPGLASNRFRVRFEVKAGARTSRPLRLRTNFPFSPEMIPVGQDAVYLKTVDEGTSSELSSASIQADGQLTPHISARVNVHFVDLYDRNPTSSDDLVALREGWVRFGVKPEVSRQTPGTTFYAQLGKFPRFARRVGRNLESYGLWGTAVGRFEEIGLESGGAFGRHFYWRGSVTNGNPLFFRDPNALAGDNGAPERLRPRPDPIFESGFPVLYDAKAQDVNLDGRFMVGAGLGFRWFAEDKERSLDLLGWYYKRRMENAARIRGTFYQGDLELLRGAGIPLPFRGRDKSEGGVNVEARWKRLRTFGTYVTQEIAGLRRDGFELELALRFLLKGVFTSGDEPVLNWIDPVVRYSRIDNHFATPTDFVAPSVGLDRRKLDLGLRLGIVRGLDLTAEYSAQELLTGAEVLHPNEGLLVLRVAF